MKARLVLSLLLLGLAAATHGQISLTVEDAASQAHQAFAPYRNLSYLWLRIAGVVWISVEWIAAIYLIHGYRMLKRRLEQESGSS